MRLRPRAVNEPLQGRILRELIAESMSTSQLAEELRERLDVVRQEIVRLHHIGIIEPIAIRHKEGEPTGRLYFRDYVWTLTQHTYEHQDLRNDCRHCRIRERLLLRAAPLSLRRRMGLE